MIVMCASPGPKKQELIITISRKKITNQNVVRCPYIPTLIGPNLKNNLEYKIAEFMVLWFLSFSNKFFIENYTFPLVPIQVSIYDSMCVCLSLAWHGTNNNYPGGILNIYIRYYF